MLITWRARRARPWARYTTGTARSAGERGTATRRPPVSLRVIVFSDFV
jgi:hypothetical protein